MEEILQAIDDLLSTVDTEWLETNQESITTLRENISTFTPPNDDLQNDNIKLLEQNEQLQGELKEQKKKFYERFMNGENKSAEENEEVEQVPLDTLLDQI